MLLLPLTDDGPSNERMYLSRHLSKSSRFNASRSNIAARNHFYFRVCVTWFRFSPKSPGNLPELRRALPSSSPPHVAPLTAIPFTLQLLHGRQVPRMFQHHHCVQPCPDCGGVWILLNHPLPADRRQGSSHGRMLLPQKS